MNNLELIKILKTFTRKEIRKFEKFISSAYHNKGRNLLPYFKEIIKYYPKFKSTRLNKEFIYLKLYPGNRFDKKTNRLMNKLNSELTLMARDFLAYNKIPSNKYLKGKLLSESLLERELFENSLEQIIKTETILNKEGIGDEYFPSMKNLIYLKSYAYEGLRKMDQYYTLSRELSLIKLIYTLIDYFDEVVMIILLKHETKINIDSLIFINVLKDLDFEKILKSIQRLNPHYAEIFELYYSMYLAYMNPRNNRLFKNFKLSVFRKLHLFDRAQSYYIIICLINLCRLTEKITNQNRSHDEYEICKTMIETEKYSYSENRIEKTVFDYVVTCFIKVKKFKETEEFIKNFANKLPALKKESFVNTALMRLNFAKKNYPEGLKYLTKIEKDDYLDIFVKHFTIQYYYELNYFDELQTVMDSFNKLLRKSKKISSYNSLRFYYFTKAVEMLIKAKSAKSPQKLLFRINNLIKRRPETFGKDWINEKIIEIEKNIN